MEYRTLEINVISAKDLKDVNLFTKMDVYAVVEISGDRRTKKKTPVDRDGGTNPTWNTVMKFTIDESAAQQNRLTLEFQLRCERSLGDKDIGEVHVPIKELLEGNKPAVQFVSYQVRKPSGKPKGELNLSYKFSEKFTDAAAAAVSKGNQPLTAYPPPMVGSSSAYPPPATAVAASKGDQPMTAYPAPMVGSSSAYPPPATGPYPPPAGYPQPVAAEYGYPPPSAAPYGGYPPPPAQPGYGYPPQQGYGYPPQQGYGYPPQQGYGYPPVQQPAKKNNKFGMGLGAGLLGGALGGLLIGDMVSDASGFDGGYDDGFGDMGGF